MAERRRRQDHHHQRAQHDQVRRIEPDQPPGHELSQAETAGQDRLTIGARQHEAGQDQEEVGGEVASLEERMQGAQRRRRLESGVKDHDESGRQEAQRVQRSASRQSRIADSFDHGPALDSPCDASVCNARAADPFGTLRVQMGFSDA